MSDNVEEIKEEKELNERQELFCQYYVSKEFFANGTQAYIEAYNIDIEQPGAYASARACASENLTKPNILKRINELLDDAGLNDSFVDKQLLFLINQNADLSVKNQAIKEYNALRSRVRNKMEHTGPNGGPIEHKHFGFKQLVEDAIKQNEPDSDPETKTEPGDIH